jgi:hypothetical protein
MFRYPQQGDYPIFWVDGIHVQASLKDDVQCLLVIIVATPEGGRSSSWAAARERTIWRSFCSTQSGARPCDGPEFAVADGALGFWQAASAAGVTATVLNSWRLLYCAAASSQTAGEALAWTQRYSSIVNAAVVLRLPSGISESPGIPIGNRWNCWSPRLSGSAGL